MENFRFKKIEPANVQDSFFKLLSKDWMLICAGNKDSYNMMTASWGNFGILWNKPVAVCYIRPQRYTYQFAEKHSSYTLNFFPEKFKHILDLCGSRSGRDINKMNIEGLNAVETPLKNIIFNEAKLAIECSKIYCDDIKPENFIDSSIEKLYLTNDYHRFYIGEIINTWIPV